MPNEILIDETRGGMVVNDSDVPTLEVLQAASENNAEIAALVTWSTNTRGWGARSRAGGLFDRDRFLAPENVFEQMRVAYDAADDDVVASFLDSSEALAFSNMEIECDDEDEEDIWAQICENMDFDQRMREVWREVNIVSQAYVACWFGKKQFKVRGKSDGGVQRKKTYNLTVPIGITVLDPLKVVPVGNFLFGQEDLCYYANPTEQDIIDSFLLGDDDSGADPIIQTLILDKYEPDFRDRKELGNLGVDPNRLYLMNPKYVWRYTTTRPGYSRFAPIRMKAIFELLDLKHQLRQADRAALIGASNFILLVKKGTDKEPAKQPEITALQSQVQNISKVPVIVGDHRLNIEIITPKTDNTLNESRYSILDLRISGRLYGMFIATHAGRDDSLKLARVVGRALESRRDMQKSAFMKHVFNPTFALNDNLLAEPDLVFHPKRISLDFDPSLATFLLDLRDRGDLSRASVLSEVDYDEADEAKRRQIEISKYDKVFNPPLPPAPPAPPAAGVPAGTVKPSAAPGQPNDPKRAGRAQGGNHGRGGNGNIGRGAGQAPRPGSPTLKIEPKLQKNGRGGD